MLILLMRHGVAVDRNGTLSDDDRPLTLPGLERTRQAGRGLRTLGVKPQLILTSPLLRASQTADAVARALDIASSHVRRTATLGPDAAPKALARYLGEHRRLDCVLCVGHAPHLDRLLGYLTTRRAATLTSIRKAGVACLDWDPDTRNAMLLWLLEPKQLRRLA